MLQSAQDFQKYTDGVRAYQEQERVRLGTNLTEKERHDRNELL
jgi:hypothetical protein